MISSSYLMLIVATLVIGMGAQWYVNHKLKTYSHVANSTGLTGAEAARQMLSYYGISNVQVFRGGPGQDYFDPRSNSVTLSPRPSTGAPSPPRPRPAMRWAMPASTPRTTRP